MSPGRTCCQVRPSVAISHLCPGAASSTTTGPSRAASSITTPTCSRPTWAPLKGQFPSPDDGRLIEWFAPTYTSYCVVDGPTSGGVGPHHVDGTGGLSQPGDLAVDPSGNVLVPEAGSTASPLSGKVLSVNHRSLPQSAADCGPDGVYPTSQLRTSVLVQGSASLLPFPQSVARDHKCHCWAVASTIGDPAIAWFDDQGHLLSSKGVVPGEGIATVGQDPNGYNPFGLAFAPDGSAYFVDIHIECSAPLTNCGPGNNVGRIMRVTFTNGVPNPPVEIASGYNFPTSVTVCVVHKQTCPLQLPAWLGPPTDPGSATGCEAGAEEARRRLGLAGPTAITVWLPFCS